MKKNFKISLLLLLVMIMILSVSSSALAMNGSGSSVDPFIIGNCTDLQSMQDVENSSIFFELNNSVDCDGFNWTPINLTTNGNFSFIGNNFSINNLSINMNGSDYVGLFGKISNSLDDVVIKDFLVNNINISGKDYVGGVIGSYQLGSGIFTNVHGTGFMSCHRICGGLLGEDYAYINNVSFRGNVIKNVINNDEADMGMVIGVALNNVNSSYAIGNITSSGTYIGGLIGYFPTSNWVYNSYSNVNVNVTNDGYYVGGLISTGNINNSYALGDVDCPNCQYGVGGLLGYAYNKKIFNSYFNGTVVGPTDPNGNQWNSNMNVSNVFYNKDVMNATPIGIGKTSAELQTQSTYSLFDTNIWDTTDGYYASFLWEGLEKTLPNTAPTILSSTLENMTTYVNGYCNASDAEGQNLTYNYQWYLDGVANESGTSSEVLESVETFIGNKTDYGTWILSCQANDGNLTSSWLNSSSITVQEIPNVAPTTPIVNITAYYGDNITVSCSSTDDGKVSYYDYLKYKDQKMLEKDFFDYVEEDFGFTDTSLSGIDIVTPFVYNGTQYIIYGDGTGGSYNNRTRIKQWNGTGWEESTGITLNGFFDINDYYSEFNIWYDESANEPLKVIFHSRILLPTGQYFFGQYWNETQQMWVNDSSLVSGITGCCLNQMDLGSDLINIDNTWVYYVENGGWNSERVFQWNGASWVSSATYNSKNQGYENAWMEFFHFEDVNGDWYLVVKTQFNGIKYYKFNELNKKWEVFTDDFFANYHGTAKKFLGGANVLFYGSGNSVVARVNSNNLTSGRTETQSIDYPVDGGNFTYECKAFDGEYFTNATTTLNNVPQYNCTSSFTRDCYAQYDNAITFSNGNVNITYPTSTFSNERINYSDIIVGSQSVFIPHGDKLNKPAHITFSNALMEEYYLLKDGTLCGSDCQNVVFDNVSHTLDFDVQGFSNYSYVGIPVEVTDMTTYPATPYPNNVTKAVVTSDGVSDNIFYYKVDWFLNGNSVDTDYYTPETRYFENSTEGLSPLSQNYKIEVFKDLNGDSFGVQNHVWYKWNGTQWLVNETYKGTLNETGNSQSDDANRMSFQVWNNTMYLFNENGSGFVQLEQWNGTDWERAEITLNNSWDSFLQPYIDNYNSASASAGANTRSTELFLNYDGDLVIGWNTGNDGSGNQGRNGGYITRTYNGTDWVSGTGYGYVGSCGSSDQPQFMETFTYRGEIFSYDYCGNSGGRELTKLKGDNSGWDLLTFSNDPYNYGMLEKFESDVQGNNDASNPDVYEIGGEWYYSSNGDNPAKLNQGKHYRGSTDYVAEFNKDVSKPGDNITYVVTPYVWEQDGSIYNGSSANHTFTMSNNPPDDPIFDVNNYYPSNRDMTGYCLVNDSDAIQGNTVFYNVYKNGVSIYSGNKSITEYSFQSNSSLLPGITDANRNNNFVQFDMNGEHWAIEATPIYRNSNAQFYGYRWNGTQYVSDNSIVSGFPTTYRVPHFDAFYESDGSVKILMVARPGTISRQYYYEWSWNGTSWVSSYKFKTGYNQKDEFTVASFEWNNERYFITGQQDGGVAGYKRDDVTGSYSYDANIKNGMKDDYGSETEVEVYKYRGNLYAIVVAKSGDTIPHYYKWNGVDAWVDGTWNDATNDFFFKSVPTTDGMQYPRIIENPENGMLGITFTNDLSSNTYSRNAFPYDMGYLSGEPVPITVGQGNLSYGSEYIFSCKTDDGYSSSNWVNSSVVNVNTQPDEPTLNFVKEYSNHIEPNENVTVQFTVNDVDEGNENTIFYSMSSDSGNTLSGNLTYAYDKFAQWETLNYQYIHLENDYPNFYEIFNMDNELYAIQTSYNGLNYGRWFNETSQDFENYPEILNGLSGSRIIREHYYWNNTDYMVTAGIHGSAEISFWNGTGWEGTGQSLSIIDNSRSHGESLSVFTIEGQHYMIVGSKNTDGFMLNETTGIWEDFDNITNGLPNSKAHAFEGYEYEGETYFILVEAYEPDTWDMFFYTWNGTIWDNDNSLSFFDGIPETIDDARMNVNNDNEPSVDIYELNGEIALSILPSDKSAYKSLVFTKDEPTSRGYLNGEIAEINIDSSNFTQGDNWTFSAYTNDGVYDSDVTEISNVPVYYEEVAPVVTDVSIFPEVITTRSSLIGSCTIEDDNDGSMLNYSYRWYKNGVIVNAVSDIQKVEGTTLSSSYGETPVEGDQWMLSCKGNDGLFDTGWQNSTTKTVIVNTAPATPSAYIQLPLQDTGSLVGICNGYDANNDTLSYNYVLYKNRVQYSSGLVSNAVSGENKTVITIYNDNLVFDDNWTMSCQSNDGIDSSGFANSTETVVVKNPIAPTSNYVQLRPTILMNNETVSVTAKGSDINLDDINYTFRLYVNGNIVETKTNNSNVQGTEVSTTFDYSTLNTGDVVKVGMIMNDVDLSAIEVFSDTFVVRLNDNAPIVNSIRLSPNIFIGEDDSVTGYCNASDSDNDTINYNYKWYVNDAVVKSGSKVFSNYYGYEQGIEIQIDTISDSYYNEGDNLTFSCSAYDAKNESQEINSSSKYIYGSNNFPPTITEVYIEPIGTQSTLVDFNISINGSDGDSSNLRYEWRFVKNGAYKPVTESDWLPSNSKQQVGTLHNEDTLAGDDYYIKARAYDGTDYSDWFTSNTVIIANTLPVMTISNITTSPLENVSLQSYCTATDIDSEQTLSFTKTWYKDGVASYFGDTLPSSQTQEGEEWILGCVANDGTNDSSELNSTGVIIVGTHNIPVIENVSLVGNNNLLTATCNASDADGDAIDYTFKWYKNNAVINTSSRLNVTQSLEQEVTISPTINDSDEFVFSCEANDNSDGSSNFTNSTTLIVPSITFNYVIASTTATTFKIDWGTNADAVEVYLDDVFQTSTTLNGWQFENLAPDTQYTVKLIPVKDEFTTFSSIFNVTTEVTDNNPPVMEDVYISPTDVYTETPVIGVCRANDVESFNLYYTYTWKVNNISVDTGVTSLYERNTNVTVGALTSSNYQYNDTISLDCTAYDGISNTGTHTANTTVLNTEPIVQDELITIQLAGGEFVCDHAYSDADGDPEQNATYTWYVNNVIQNASESSGQGRLYTDVTSVGDEVICQLHTGDAYHNITENSSVFTVGDFENPVISDVEFPTSVYTDTASLVSTVCSDNLGVANNYPKIRFINPNYQQEEYPLYYEGADTYQKYQTFNIAGEYTNIEVECRDGNANQEIFKYNGTVYAKVRETVVTVGGGGGSSPEEPPKEFRNITSFELNPSQKLFSMSAGSTVRGEFEVVNKDIVDVAFTSAILRTDNGEAYEWMSFDGNSKTTSFNIKKENGLSSNSKFLRFTITVPSDAKVGTYNGVIEINGMEQTEQFNVEIEVTQGTFVRLFNTLQEPLFELPFSLSSATPTGAVTGTLGNTGGSTPITPVTLIIVTGISGLGIFTFLRLRA